MQEYVRAEDVGEVEKGLRALAVPFFHHEFVRQAIVIALHNTPKQGAVLSLLGSLAESGFLSTTQIVRVWPTLTNSLHMHNSITAMGRISYASVHTACLTALSCCHDGKIAVRS